MLDIFYLGIGSWPPPDHGKEGSASYLYRNSWSYEGSGPAAADILNQGVAVAATAPGVYTHTFPAANKPREIVDVWCNSSVAGRSFAWAYDYSTGVLTITVSAATLAVDFDLETSLLTWEPESTDEEIITLLALCNTY